MNVIGKRENGFIVDIERHELAKLVGLSEYDDDLKEVYKGKRVSLKVTNVVKKAVDIVNCYGEAEKQMKRLEGSLKRMQAVLYPQPEGEEEDG